MFEDTFEDTVGCGPIAAGAGPSEVAEFTCSLTCGHRISSDPREWADWYELRYERTAFLRPLRQSDRYPTSAPVIPK